MNYSGEGGMLLQLNPKLHEEVDSQPSTKATVHPIKTNESAGGAILSPAAAAVRLAPPRKGNQPQFPPANFDTNAVSQMRVPVIIGEVTFRGMAPVDGIVLGSPGANGGTLTVRQRGRPFFGSDPELDGEISFRDMLRVNGHIAGSVCSKKGTLIVDARALIDANVEVSVAIIDGTVNGDVVAHQKVELGPAAKIHGNIWTRSLSIQNGAIFDGVCQMIEGKEDAS
jgi:cytoskeletal protein CcmA (bactofilin family)